VKQEIRIDLLSPKGMMVIFPHPPGGVQVTGLRSDAFNGPTGGEVAVFFLVTVPSGIALNLLSSWLYERIKNHQAKRFKIQGIEPKDKDDFDRIVQEQLEIGKND
jgi:hypothetical protein